MSLGKKISPQPHLKLFARDHNVYEIEKPKIELSQIAVAPNPAATPLFRYPLYASSPLITFPPVVLQPCDSDQGRSLIPLMSIP